MKNHRWLWMVTDRASNVSHRYDYRSSNYFLTPCGFEAWIYASGEVVGTRQDAVNRARLDLATSRQVIRVFRIGE